jgi:hypothetical protein
MKHSNIGTQSGTKPESIRSELTPVALLIAFQIVFAFLIALSLAALEGWRAAFIALAALLFNDLAFLVGIWIIYRQQINALRRQLFSLIKEARHDQAPRNG